MLNRVLFLWLNRKSIFCLRQQDLAGRSPVCNSYTFGTSFYASSYFSNKYFYGRQLAVHENSFPLLRHSLQFLASLPLPVAMTGF